MNQKVKDALDSLTSKVQADTTVTQSAVTLLEGLSAQIAALKDLNPDEVGAAIDALASSVGAQTQKLADAVVANTPAA